MMSRLDIVCFFKLSMSNILIAQEKISQYEDPYICPALPFNSVVIPARCGVAIAPLTHCTRHRVKPLEAVTMPANAQSVLRAEGETFMIPTNAT